MTLGDGPALLVLSGQGIGSGVEHFTSPISFEAEYPPRHLLETWCSLTDPVIPNTPDEIVLMVARQSTGDGTPWTILSEYVQANLKRSRRGKHYAGVGLAVKERMLPIEAIPLVHNILAAMLLAKMEGQHFIESIGDWSPSATLLKDIEALAVEPLRPGFEGIQPGMEEARIVHSMNPDGIVRESQERGEYRDFCAAFVIRRKGKPEKDSCYVRSPHDVGPWEEARSPARPMPVQGSASVSPRSLEFFSHGRDDYGETRPRSGHEYGSPSLAKVSSDLNVLEGTVAQLARRVQGLEAVSIGDLNHRKSNIPEWAVVCAAITIVLFVVSVLVKDVFAGRSAWEKPIGASQSNLEDESQSSQPNGNSSSSNTEDSNIETEGGPTDGLTGQAATALNLSDKSNYPDPPPR